MFAFDFKIEVGWCLEVGGREERIWGWESVGQGGGDLCFKSEKKHIPPSFVITSMF